ncbi:hypothetical protein, partial [Porphyromonas loveana]|uniref:hypothetical protein n=1 Tax=Porphyromonas loveana TaxID=1884669 RepID=UPI0035A008A5
CVFMPLFDYSPIIGLAMSIRKLSDGIKSSCIFFMFLSFGSPFLAHPVPSRSPLFDDYLSAY